MPDEIRAVLGDRGACKTLFTVWIMSQTVDQGGAIASNIHSLQLPQMYFKFTELVDIISAGQGKQVFGHKVITIDEMGKGADSYDFFQKSPRKISELVFELRKYRSILYYTAQRFGTVAKRIREQTDVFYLLDAIPVAAEWAHANPDEVNKLLDGRYVLKGRAHVRMCDSTGYRIMREFEFDGRAFYTLYDTYEVIGTS